VDLFSDNPVVTALISIFLFILLLLRKALIEAAKQVGKTLGDIFSDWLRRIWPKPKIEDVRKAPPDKIADTAKEEIGSSPPRLNQLPADIDDFVERENEVDDLVTLLTGGDSNAAISAIGGMGGIGKTTLAVRVAHRLTSQYSDAQIVVDMNGTDENPISPYEAMENVIRAFHPDAKLPDDPEAITQTYHSVLSGQNALIILDNAKDSAQVRELVPKKPVALIVTSRRTISLPGVHPIDLDVLPEEKARSVLLSITGENRAAESELVEIAKLCGKLPLALRVAGSFIKVHPNWTAAEYIKELKEKRKHLRQDGLDVEATLGVSAAQLAREKAKLAEQWQMLSVFPASFDRPAVAAVWDVTEDEARDGLGILLERNLLLFDKERRRFRLHDLMRPVAENVFSFTDEITDEVRNRQRILTASFRHSAYYAALLEFADELYLKGGDSIIEGLSLFDTERENIIKGQKWASINWKDDDNVAELCSQYPDAGAYILTIRLHPRERIRWLEEALNAARKLKNRRTEGFHLGNLGIAYADLGETKRAIDYHELRLEIAREIGDQRAEGQDLGNLGNAYKNLGETKRAIEYHEKALVISREIGDQRAEGQDLGNMGIAYANLGETKRAIEYHEKALVISRKIGDRSGEGATLGNLGTAYADLGETKRAIEYHEKALVITRKIGDRSGEGAALGNMGNAYANLGETKRAIDYYEQVLEIHRETGERRGEGNALGNLGNAYAILGETKRAIEYYKQQLVITRETGERRGEGNALFNMSISLYKLGEREKAIAHAEAALKIYEQIEDPSAEKVRKILAEWRGGE